MLPEELVTLTINGRETTVSKGTLLVEAARLADIEIPVFCYHPKLKSVGACRMCLVEIEKMPRLQTACTTPVADGMVVRSNSPGALAGQNSVLELLLANHPLDCPICDKGGECPLQDNTFKYGPGISRMVEEKRHQDKAFPLSDRIVLDKERCIMCFRCVRFQQEIAGDEALAVIDRGAGSEIGTLTGEPFDSPFSGNTIELCPVGALTSRQYRFRARPWDLMRTRSVCVGCAVGCNVELHARDGRILRMVAADNPEVDDGWLCDLGRFDTLPSLSGRPTSPLVRRDGNLEPATWDQALARAADILVGAHGVRPSMHGSPIVLASPSLTNEALWLLAGPLRAALPDGAVGFWPRTGQAPSTSSRQALPLQGTLANLPNCGRIVLVGLDPWTELPVLALWIRKATIRSGSLVAIGPRNGLFRDTAAWLRVENEEIAATLRGLLSALEDGAASEDIRQAAVHLQGEGPTALLIGPEVAADEARRLLVQALAERLGANGIDGMIGCPALGANERGARELAPDLMQTDLTTAGDTPGPLLLFSDGPWQIFGQSVRILATSSLIQDPHGLEVVLPLAHPYEQAGSLTNIEGRVQELMPGGIAPPDALPDWAALARLANALGASAPTGLAGIRAALSADHPQYERAVAGGLPAAGRLLENRLIT